MAQAAAANVLCNMIWGMYIAVGRSVSVLISAEHLLLLRFSAGCATAAVFNFLPPGRRKESLHILRSLSQRDWMSLLMLGWLTIQASYPFLIGLGSVESLTAASIDGWIPLFTLGCDLLMLTGVHEEKSRINKMHGLGAAVTVAGTGVILQAWNIVGSAHYYSGSWYFGCLLCFSGSFSYAALLATQKPFLPLLPSPLFTFVTLITGTVFMFIVSANSLGLLVHQLLANAGFLFWFGVLFNVLVVSWAPVLLTAVAIRKSNGVLSAVYTGIIPICAALFTWILIGEVPPVTTLVGAPIVLLGVALCSVADVQNSLKDTSSPQIVSTTSD